MLELQKYYLLLHPILIGSSVPMKFIKIQFEVLQNLARFGGYSFDV